MPLRPDVLSGVLAGVRRAIRQRSCFDNPSTSLAMVDPEVMAIDAAMAAQSRSRAEVARLLGLDSSQVSRIFAGRRRLQRHEYSKLVEWLGISTPSPHVAGGAIVPMPGMVPLYGWVGAASDERLTLADQNLRGYVPMHPNQAHVKDAFALEVADISMSPRYEPGEVVYLAPHRWPTRGQDCVLVTTDSNGFLKRFIRRDETSVHLHQLNPNEDLTFELSLVEAVHAVVGRG
jgi:phage repressor protein C with HTH and peptisase S24 domain